MKTIIIALSACLMLTACDKTPDSSLIGSIVKEKTASDVAKEVANYVIHHDYDKAIALSTEKPHGYEKYNGAIPVFEYAKEIQAMMAKSGKEPSVELKDIPYTLSIAEEEITLGTKIINGVKQPDIARIIVKADAGNGRGKFFKMRLSNVDGNWRVFDFN